MTAVSAEAAAAKKTRAILDAAQGKVLFIDECYVLDDALYWKQVLDTIVERVMGAPGEDICVIMAGYKAPVLKMLRDQNPGLSCGIKPIPAVGCRIGRCVDGVWEQVCD